MSRAVATETTCEHCGVNIHFGGPFTGRVEADSTYHDTERCRAVLKRRLRDLDGDMRGILTARVDETGKDAARRVMEEIDAATSFRFNGPTNRLGDYVLVDYYDEDDNWQMSVHTCETRGMPEPVAFKSRREALVAARRIASGETTGIAR